MSAAESLFMERRELSTALEENRPGSGSEIKKSTGKAFPNPFFCGIVKYKFGRRLEEQSMKKLTINEIAEKAGVSKTTVSFYLNGKANKMSEEAADSADY